MDMQEVQEKYYQQIATMLDIVADLDDEDHKDSFDRLDLEDQFDILFNANE